MHIFNVSVSLFFFFLCVYSLFSSLAPLHIQSKPNFQISHSHARGGSPIVFGCRFYTDPCTVHGLCCRLPIHLSYTCVRNSRYICVLSYLSGEVLGRGILDMAEMANQWCRRRSSSRGSTGIHKTQTHAHVHIKHVNITSQNHPPTLPTLRIPSIVPLPSIVISCNYELVLYPLALCSRYTRALSRGGFGGGRGGWQDAPGRDGNATAKNPAQKEPRSRFRSQQARGGWGGGPSWRDKPARSRLSSVFPPYLWLFLPALNWSL